MPTDTPDHDPYPRLRTALLDRQILAEFFESLDTARSPKTMRALRVDLVRFIRTAGGDEALIDYVARLADIEAKRRRGYTPRPRRVAERAPALFVVEGILVWDKTLHRPEPPRSIQEARDLRDRVAAWLLLLCGPRIENVVALRVTGPEPHLLFSNGRLRTLVLREHETKNNARITLPIGDIPGLAALFEVYIRYGRPLLLPAGSTVEHFLVNDRGKPFTEDTFREFFHRRLRRPAFGDLDLYVHYFRRVCVTVLRDLFGLPWGAIAAVIGDTEDTVKDTYYTQNPESTARGWADGIMGRPTGTEAERLRVALRAWLDQIASDFQPFSAPVVKPDRGDDREPAWNAHDPGRS